jgi:hypothetical protein
VEFGFGGAPVASITVAWMMALVAGWGLEQAERETKRMESRRLEPMDLGTFVL